MRGGHTWSSKEDTWECKVWSDLAYSATSLNTSDHSLWDYKHVAEDTMSEGNHHHKKLSHSWKNDDLLSQAVTKLKDLKLFARTYHQSVCSLS